MPLPSVPVAILGISSAAPSPGRTRMRACHRLFVAPTLPYSSARTQGRSLHRRRRWPPPVRPSVCLLWAYFQASGGSPNAGTIPPAQELLRQGASLLAARLLRRWRLNACYDLSYSRSCYRKCSPSVCSSKSSRNGIRQRPRECQFTPILHDGPPLCRHVSDVGFMQGRSPRARINAHDELRK